MPLPVEVHWDLILERYHDPLHRIMKKLRTSFSNVPLDTLHDYANMAMSHTLGRPEGRNRAIIAFGAQSRLPIGDYLQQLQTVVQRMDLATVERREMEIINAILRTQTALRSAPANQYIFGLVPGD